MTEEELDAIRERAAAFIAHARTDIPALLDEVERLWAALQLSQSETEGQADLVDEWIEKATAAEAEVEQLQDLMDKTWRERRLAILESAKYRALLDRAEALIPEWRQHAEEASGDLQDFGWCADRLAKALAEADGD